MKQRECGDGHHREDKEGTFIHAKPKGHQPNHGTESTEPQQQLP